MALLQEGLSTWLDLVRLGSCFAQFEGRQAVVTWPFVVVGVVVFIRFHQLLSWDQSLYIQ